ncbi:hypothetical protein J6590_075249 [Homalodisca vitripennis]|nr:hypothetical protein J6590_075248 [Homalodisca vitripennis]KAG8246872.1 hypothetical protein J6590_075249 [Homalodisca vitripennis]
MIHKALILKESQYLLERLIPEGDPERITRQYGDFHFPQESDLELSNVHCRCSDVTATGSAAARGDSLIALSDSLSDPYLTVPV